MKNRDKYGFHKHRYHDEVTVTRKPLPVFSLVVGKTENEDTGDASMTPPSNEYHGLLSHTVTTEERRGKAQTQHTHEYALRPSHYACSSFTELCKTITTTTLKVLMVTPRNLRRVK
jgi:O-acetyl-ADP-ribose deacetylase (regulator of RNase III)